MTDASLPLNAIASVTLSDLFPMSRSRANSKPGFLTMDFQRQEAPSDLLKPSIGPIISSKEPPFIELPPRPPSRLPPPGHAHLRASLGAYLGHGHSSVVFDLADIRISGVPPGVTAPALVAKISRLNRVTSLLRERWFYDDLECLQGVSIPRCYGYYEANIQHNPAVKQQLLALQAKYPAEDEGDENVVISRDEMQPPLHHLLAERRERRDIIAIIILEKLGPHLPLGERVSDEIKEDLYSLFEDFAHCCVNADIDNIRWENILQAPESPPGLPSLPSPLTQKVHKWRALDLEQAIKVNRSVWNCQLDDFYGLDRMYYLMEMWEPPEWPDEDSADEGQYQRRYNFDSDSNSEPLSSGSE